MVKLVATNLLTNMVAKDFQGFSFFSFFEGTFQDRTWPNDLDADV